MAILHGYYFKSDLTDWITDEEATYFNINVHNSFWLKPFAMMEQFSGELHYDAFLDDGVYALTGIVSYPSKERLAAHRIAQFNLCLIQGVAIKLLRPYNDYPNLPEVLPLSPAFPLIRLGPPQVFKPAIRQFHKHADQPYSIDYMIALLRELDGRSLEYKIVALKLALTKNLFHPLSARVRK